MQLRGSIEREVIDRGVFTLVADLRKKVMRYIGDYNKTPRRLTWKYSDPGRRFGARSTVTGQ